MAKKKLTVSEALLLFESLPSDEESGVSDFDESNEEYVPDPGEIEEAAESEDSSGFDLEDPDSILTAPGPSKPVAPTWSKRYPNSSSRTFREETGPSVILGRIFSNCCFFYFDDA